MAKQAQNLDPGFSSQRYSLAYCFILIFSVGCQDVGYWLPSLSSCSSGNLLVGSGRSDGEVLLPRGCVVWSVTGCAILCDFLYGAALSRDCWRVSNPVVFWIQSRTACERVESNTKKYSHTSFVFLKGTTFLNWDLRLFFFFKGDMLCNTFTSALEIFI